MIIKKWQEAYDIVKEIEIVRKLNDEDAIYGIIKDALEKACQDERNNLIQLMEKGILFWKKQMKQFPQDRNYYLGCIDTLRTLKIELIKKGVEIPLRGR